MMLKCFLDIYTLNIVKRNIQSFVEEIERPLPILFDEITPRAEMRKILSLQPCFYDGNTPKSLCDARPISNLIK